MKTSWTLALSALAALPATAGPLRLAIVTGGHGFEREPFFAMWSALEGLTWREVEQPEANDLYSPAQRGSWDVIVLYDMVQPITDQQLGWLRECLAAGKGLLVLHHAIASYQAHESYARLIGGRFFLAPQELDGAPRAASTYREGLEYTVRIAAGDHPICRGLVDFELEDEVYGGYWVAHDVQPLLTVRHPDSGEIVGWTRTEGPARIVYLMPGHGPGAFGHPTYRELVRRAALWAGQRLGVRERRTVRRRTVGG